MVEIDPTLAIIAVTLRIPLEWLTWPLVLTNILIPFIVMAGGFYYFLNNKLRIFQYVIVNMIIAAVMAFVLLPFSKITIYLGLLMIAFTGIQTWGNRVLFFAIVLSFYFFLDGKIRLIVYTLAGGGLVGIIFNNSMFATMKVILVAGIAIGLYFLLPYIPETFNIFGPFG